MDSWDSGDIDDGSADSPLDYENGGGGGGYLGDPTFSGGDDDDWDFDVITLDPPDSDELADEPPEPQTENTEDNLPDLTDDDEQEYDDEGIPIVADQSIDVTATPDPDPATIEIWSNPAFNSTPDLGSIITAPDQSIDVTATPDDPQPIDVTGDHDFVSVPIYAAYGETEEGDEDEDAEVLDITKNYAKQWNPPPAFDSPGTKPSQKPQQGGYPSAPTAKAASGSAAPKQSWLWLIVLLIVALAVWYEVNG